MGSNDSSGRLTFQINVTPLVDVVLVLLIIFMVVTPMLDQGPVRLPLTARPAAHPDQKRIVVVLNESHGLFLNVPGESTLAASMSQAQLEARIRDAHARDAALPIAVKADSRLTYGDVKAVLMTIQRAGFPQVGLVARERPPAPVS